MGVDPIYDTLRPFHLWAEIVAPCALVLASATCILLIVSRRGSPRWWLGLGFFALCLASVAFGERSRMAAGDLRSIATCYVRWVSGCEVWTLWLTDAVNRINVLGPAVVTVAALGLIATLVTFYSERQIIARRISAAPARSVFLILGVVVAGIGAALIADGVARWIETAYLADIARAGDGLGQLPLIDAILGTIFASAILAAGLALTLGAALARDMPQTPQLAN